MWWFHRATRRLSTRQALKILLKKNYRSAKEYEACLVQLEQATGHPDPEGFLQRLTPPLKSRQVLAELRGEAALFNAMVCKNKAGR